MSYKKGLPHPRQVSVLSGLSTLYMDCQPVQVFPTLHLRSEPSELPRDCPSFLCPLFWYLLNPLSLLLSLPF